MNTKNITMLAAASLAAILLSGCKSGDSVAAYHSAPVECMGVEHDGSQTLRVTGTGRNKADAVEQAKKKCGA